MAYRTLLLFLCSLLLPYVLFAQWGGGLNSAPNIVLIMLDDVGYFDVGVNSGNPNSFTPEIDAIAARGINLTQYHTMGARCSPTRASMITGRYPATFGFDYRTNAESLRGLPRDWPTLPQALQDAGYATWHVGKWHLGKNYDFYRPCNKGFQESRRLTRRPRTYVDAVIDENCQGEPYAQYTGHTTRIVTDLALELIQQHSLSTSRDDPFFLSLWYWAPHTPLQPPSPQDPPPPDGTPSIGLDPSFLPPYCPHDPGDIQSRTKFESLLCYADFQIGRVFRQLQFSLFFRPTLFIVTSDNGGSAKDWHGPNGSLRGAKSTLFEGGLRVPLVARWIGNPRAIPPGSESADLFTSMDWLETLTDLAGIDSTAPTDGASFAHLFTGEGSPPPERTLFWDTRFSKFNFTSSSGILNWGAARSGQWKLVVEPSIDSEPSFTPHLFDIDADPSESNDLYDMFPAQGDQLFDQWLDWRKQVSKRLTVPVEFLGGASQTDSDSGTLSFSSPGLITLAENGENYLHDGHFTFKIRIRPDAIGPDKQRIATKAGSWRIVLRANGTIGMNVWGENVYDGVQEVARLQTEIDDPITSGEWHDIAFTVRNWTSNRNNPDHVATTIRLYVDDRPVAEDTLSTAIRHLERPITLGSEGSGLRQPFTGQMEIPETASVDLYERQIRAAAEP